VKVSKSPIIVVSFCWATLVKHHIQEDLLKTFIQTKLTSKIWKF